MMRLLTKIIFLLLFLLPFVVNKDVQNPNEGANIAVKPVALMVCCLLTATLFIIIFLTPNYTDSSLFKTLLPALFSILQKLVKSVLS